MSGILSPGESATVHGSYSIHIFAPAGTGTLVNSHFPDEPASFVPVDLLNDEGSASVFIDLAGTVRFDSADPDARCSLVAINIGGSR
ncbi:MAG TPA: hypothetical protein DDW52_10210 [Planctomycetaceae bacterium]|nr:hypothetical protein [Planctomycetaceae bacterium]